MRLSDVNNFNLLTEKWEASKISTDGLMKKKNIILSGLPKNQLNYFYQLYNTDLSSVFIANSLEEIVEKKLIVPQIDFIIMSSLIVEAEPKLVEELIKNNLVECEIFILGIERSVVLETEKIKFIEESHWVDILKDHIYKDEDFIPLFSGWVERGLVVPCDFYIRLSDSKFVKVFNGGTELSIKDINKYRAKNIHSFYVRTANLKEAEQILIYNEEKKEMPRSADGTIEKEVAINYVTDELAKLIAPESKEALLIAGKSFNRMIDDVQKTPEGISYINQFLKGDSYHYTHTAALACLLTLMSQKAEWNIDSIADKMRMAALFHDISLGIDAKDEISWLKLNSVEKIKHEAKLNAFFQHPKKSADIFIALLPSYNDVEKIILEHHERPNGTGFPRGSTHQNINSLSSMFIVAENFIGLVFGADLDNTLKNYALKILEKKYGDGNFKKSFQALQKVVAL